MMSDQQAPPPYRWARGDMRRALELFPTAAERDARRFEDIQTRLISLKGAMPIDEAHWFSATVADALGGGLPISQIRDALVGNTGAALALVEALFPYCEYELHRLTRSATGYGFILHLGATSFSAPGSVSSIAVLHTLALAVRRGTQKDRRDA